MPRIGRLHTEMSNHILLPSYDISVQSLCIMELQEPLVAFKRLGTFHQFPRLPKEIQIHIWREFILDANQHRIVLFDKRINAILPTKHLTSSNFCINFLSRQVFLDLCPMQYPIYTTGLHESSSNYPTDSNDNDEYDEYHFGKILLAAHKRRGSIYVNFNRDFFATTTYEDFFPLDQIRIITKAWRHRSSFMYLETCRRVKNISKLG